MRSRIDSTFCVLSMRFVALGSQYMQASKIESTSFRTFFPTTGIVPASERCVRQRAHEQTPMRSRIDSTFCVLSMRFVALSSQYMQASEIESTSGSVAAPMRSTAQAW